MQNRMMEKVIQITVTRFWHISIDPVSEERMTYDKVSKFAKRVRGILDKLSASDQRAKDREGIGAPQAYCRHCPSARLCLHHMQEEHSPPVKALKAAALPR
jgi:hypothetical protein